MSQQLLDMQVALSHLSVALGLLDSLGADVSAVHVDSAIHALRDEARLKFSFAAMLEDERLDFTRFDAMVDQICDSRVIALRH